MSKKHKNQINETVNDVEVTEINEKETEEMEVMEKKSFGKKALELGGKVVKSTPFKVAAGVILGAGAAIGGLTLLSKSGDNDDYADLDFEDDMTDIAAETSEAASAEEN